MKRNISRILLVALVLILGVGAAVSYPQTATKSTAPAAAAPSTSLVDIKSATKDQLAGLPGID